MNNLLLRFRFSALVVSTLLCLAPAAATRAADDGYEAQYGALLRKYVAGEGVRYSDWKANAADMAALQGVGGAPGTTPPPARARNPKTPQFL